MSDLLSPFPPEQTAALLEDMERGERKAVADDIPEYQDTEDSGVSDGWHIEDLASADWALSRLADLEQEIAETEALEQAALLRLRARTELLTGRARRGIAFFESRLREFAETHRAELLKGSKKKSRALLNGELAWRKAGGGLVVRDPDALLGWASAQPEDLGLLRVKASPDLPAIKKHAKSTGEIPAGCDIEAEREEFSARPVRK